MGKEQLLSCLGPFLEGEKESRVEVVNLILANEEWLPRADVRDYPKGLVSCLCDKNKEVRAQSEKLFEKIYEKIGMETFRQIAKDQRPAFVKDLNAFFNRFDKAQSVFSSKKVSPAKNPEKEKRLSTTVISQPPSAKKRSLSKTNLPTASPDTLS